MNWKSLLATLTLDLVATLVLAGNTADTAVQIAAKEMKTTAKDFSELINDGSKLTSSFSSERGNGGGSVRSLSTRSRSRDIDADLKAANAAKDAEAAEVAQAAKTGNPLAIAVEGAETARLTALRDLHDTKARTILHGTSEKDVKAYTAAIQAYIQKEEELKFHLNILLLTVITKNYTVFLIE